MPDPGILTVLLTHLQCPLGCILAASLACMQITLRACKATSIRYATARHVQLLSCMLQHACTRMHALMTGDSTSAGALCVQFDYNRVVLHETEDNDTGYINATLMESGQKEGSFWQAPNWHYIVSQVTSPSLPSGLQCHGHAPQPLHAASAAHAR